MDSEKTCKHSKVQRNCYACHLEYINSQEKTQLDTLHETICELKIRVSKLEEYKRLQDDLNKHINNDIHNLNGHRKKQIDENRAVSKHLTDLDEFYSNQAKENKAIYDKFTNINDQIINIEKGMKLWEITQSSQNRNFNNRISSLEKNSIPTNIKGLTFEEAIVAFKNHKSIYRNGWEYSINYLDKTIHLNIDDLLATDWEIIE